jgi:hypothetical protein
VKEPDEILENLCAALHETWDGSAHLPIQDNEDDAPIFKFLSKDIGHETRRSPAKQEPQSPVIDGGDFGSAVGPAPLDSTSKVATLRQARVEKEG